MEKHSHPYDEYSISLIEQMLFGLAEEGSPVYYEVLVDDVKVVPRTRNVKKFEQHEMYVHENTKTVTVQIYIGNSRRHKKHIYYVGGIPQNDKVTREQFESLLQQALSEERKRWDWELLVNENTKLKQNLKEAEEYIDVTNQKIRELQEQKNKAGENWGQIASVALEGLIRRNTHLITKLTGIEGLAGIIESDTKERDQQLKS